MTKRQGGRRVLGRVFGLAMLLAVAVVARAGLPALSFAPFVNVSLGPPGCTDGVDCSEGALDATAGDFNRDGKLDIATANNGSDDVTVLLGNGSGGLTSSTTLTASAGPSGIASGNLNSSDTILDLVVAKELSNKIGVFLGKGDGSFQDEVEYAMGNSPQAVVLADFNGDATLDVATADLFGDTVSVRLGKGDGTFGDLKQVTVSGGPYGMAAGKVDGGNTIDLLVSLYDNAQVAVLLGKGDGTFQRSAGVIYSGVPTEGDALTINTQAYEFTNGVPSGTAAGVAIVDGDADATFANLVAAIEANQPSLGSVTQHTSTTTVQIIAPSDVTITKGQDAGDVIAIMGAVDDAPRGIALADLNHDGKLDAGVATESFDSVDVLLGNGDGTFQVPGGCLDADQRPVTCIVGGFPESVVAADLNGDGITDLASADSFGTIDFDGTVSVLLGKGNGTFEDAQQFQVDSGPYGLVAADLNNDRLPDLVTANLDGETVSVLKNTGTPPAITCVGDCDGTGMVTIGELITGVNIALGTFPVSQCPAFDANGDGMVGITELITAVNNALNGCPAG
jgi:hypothetical protein